MQQQQLPFGWKFAEDRAALVQAIRLAKVKTAGETLLLWIHDVAQGDELRRSYAEISERLGCSKRTAQRLVSRLVELGLLAVLENRYRTGGQRENGYAIDWEGVRAITFSCPPPRLAKVVAPPRQNVTPSRHSVTPPRQNVTPLKEYTHLGSTSDPPPPLEEALGAAGVKDLSVLRVAAGRGCTAEHLGELLEHYRRHPGAWGPGALAYRIRNARPDLLPCEGWPDHAPEYTRARDREVREREMATQAAAAARSRAAADRARDQTEELEARYGATLDALEASQLEELAEAALGHLGEFGLDQFHREPQSVRLYLLEALAE